MAADAVKASDLFREKVVARYYSVTAHLQPLSTATTTATTTAADPPVETVNSVSTSQPESVPSPSDDTALTAFAQLAVFKLEASRAFITLIDSRYHYVLAEATRSLSLQGKPLADNDSLVLGAVTLLKKDAGISNLLFGHCLQLEAERSKSPDLRPGVVVVNDLQQVNEFANSSWVVAGPQFRFAAAVPLTGLDGTVVGMLTIYDDRVHADGISLEQKVFLEHMGRTIMAHLDAVRVQAEYKRRDKLINGLESFLEGLSDLRVSLRGATNYESKVRKPDKVAQGDADVDEDIAHKKNMSSPQPSQTQHSVDTDVDSASLWESALPSGSRSMFSRASRIIRQAGDWDGVAFFYAASTPRTRDKSPRGPLLPRNDHLMPSRRLSTSSSQPSSDDPSDGRKSRADSITEASATDDPDASNVPCPLLSYALSDSERKKQSEGTSLFASFTQRDLQRVFEKPKGRVFVLNDQARAVAGDSSNTDSGLESAVSAPESAPKSDGDIKNAKRPRRKRTRRIISLLKLSPTARSFTILPLWDLERQRWFSYCICWSSAPRDPALDGGLSYLRIFGSIVLSALSHIDALAADRAKTSFVASISHELRSPLHGILGANNFLADSQLTHFQEEMVESITSCGRTLLDTLEHVMDFSKINSFNGSKDSRKGARNSRPKITLPADRRSSSVSQDRGSMTRPVNLGLLIEEVVEAIVMGYTVQHEFLFSDEKSIDDWVKTSSDRSAVGDMTDRQNTLLRRTRVRVALILPPEHHAWLATEPGAWRRIVSNLTANSLKYTTEGLITVQLGLTEDQERKGSVKAVLTVRDSGRGISNEYLQNYLFRPFSQEDSFASGTGLGLSIVSQVVQTLHGTVDVTSTKGIGTKVAVEVTIPRTDAPSSDVQQMGFIPMAVEQMEGLTVCVLEDTALRASDNINTVQRTSNSSFSQILLQTIKAWFKVDASIQDQWLPRCGDIVICLEPSFKHLENIRSYASDLQLVPPVIFIAADALELAALRADARILSSASVVEVICQPVGPRKLAKSLAQCVMRTSKSRDTDLQLQPVPQFQRLRVSNDTSPSSSSGSASEDTAYRVLICDDNPVNLRLLATFLRRQKAYHEEAENGQEALNRYVDAKGNFDVIFMDISMPVMDGITSTKLIRRFEKENSLPKRAIIALTGLASASAKSEAEEAGIDEFITKPINFKMLQDLLRKNVKA